MKKFRTQRTIASLLVLLGVVACAASDISEAKKVGGRAPVLAETPENDELVRGANDPAIVTLELGGALRERRLREVDELPSKIIIPTTNLNAVPVTAALQGILAGTDVSLAWDAGKLGTRLVSVANLSGPLPRVIDKICSAAKVFCNYRNGSIELSEKETFIVAMPPIAKTLSSTGTSATSSGTNSMVEAVTELVNGEKVKLDEHGGNIIYTATVDGEERVNRYLTELRTGRPLVVLQLYIWEVALSADNAQGINWSEFKIGKLRLNSTQQLTSLATTSGAVNIGAVTSGVISSTSVASFLATKGRVQTISNPQITFVSGTNAQLKVGGTQRYISQVGTATSTTSGTTNNTSTNTVSTDEIETGLTVNVAGAYENGVVFANMDMAIKNLVSLNPTTSGGQTIDLPETSDEKISTVLRVRPGDSLLMAGVVSNNTSLDSQGFPVGDSSIPLYGKDSRTNRELVMIVKPAIVQFKESTPEEEKKKAERNRPLPDAVVIDKDGAQRLVLPQASKATTLPTPVPMATAAPELMVSSANAEPTRDIALAPSDDSAPVDKRLMQRGFSRAYDQLLQPSAGGTSK